MSKAKEQPLIRLDLGCGQNKQEGFIGVDIMDGADVVFDLFSASWPWDADSVDEIHCSHFIEHVPDLIAFMNECHRILKPHGKMTVIAPYWTSVRCWQDPTHKNAISEHSFLYYNRNFREVNRLDHYPITADFDFSYAFQWNGDWALRSDAARNFALVHYNNVVSDIYVTLTKRENAV